MGTVVHWPAVECSIMKYIVALTIILPFVSSKYIQRDIPDDCKYFTVGKCDPSVDEEIETYPIPNVESAVSLCQEVCQIQEGCNFFEYNSKKEECLLFHYRYLDSCELIGGTAEPTLDVCSKELENTCNSFVREDCEYGDLVFNKTSVTDSHACQQLLATVGFVYKAEYFVYDSLNHVCDFFTKKESTCDTLSGPVFPDFDECNKDASTTVAPTTGKATSTPATTATSSPATTKPASTAPTTTASP